MKQFFINDIWRSFIRKFSIIQVHECAPLEILHSRVDLTRSKEISFYKSLAFSDTNFEIQIVLRLKFDYHNARAVCISIADPHRKHCWKNSMYTLHIILIHIILIFFLITNNSINVSCRYVPEVKIFAWIMKKYFFCI